MARLLALILFGLAIAAAVRDYIIVAGKAYPFSFRPIGQHWFELDSYSLQLLQPALERHGAEWLWDPVLLSILIQPAAPVLAGLGAMLFVLGGLGRRKAARRTTRQSMRGASNQQRAAPTRADKGKPHAGTHRPPHTSTSGPVRRMR